MKYAIVAAAAGIAAAMPAADADWVPYTTSTTSEWETWTTTSSSVWETWTTTSSAWETWTTTTPAAVWSTWETYPAPEKKTCTTTYTTKECGGNSGAWDNCNVVTKTDTLYDDKCTWYSWEAPKPTASTWSTWEAYPSPEKVCTYESTWTTKECGTSTSGWNTWATCSDVTSSSVYTDEKCTGTWAPYTYETPAAAATWSAYSTVASVKAAETWSAASVPVKPAASSTVWSPVAKFTGAADKQAAGMGAIAIAAVAMLL